MKKCTFYFITVLSLLCLVLLGATWHFDPNKGGEIAERLLNSRIPTPPSGSIPVIVVHSTRMDLDKPCHQYYDPKDVEVETLADVWQKLTVNESTLFVYSMHVDERLPSDNYLRVMAMSEGRFFAGRVFCKVWFQGATTLAVEADIDELWVRNWDAANPVDYFRPLMLSCPFPKRTPPVVAASLLPEPCVLPSNVFFFNKTEKYLKTKVKGFAICLKPMNFGGRDITTRLLEWMELQFLLGADHITVYVTRHWTHPNVRKVLDHYHKSGNVTLRTYVSPSGDDSDYSSRLWQKRRHEMLVYNDCFYNYVGKRKWVVNLDLDEAIVPLLDNTWGELMDRLAKKNPKVLKTASVSAPNVYFFDQFGVDQSGDVPAYFHMLKHLYRSSNFTPPGFAQKSFCSTLLAHIVTHHYALRGLHPFLHLSVPGGREHLQMHHYRASCPRDMDQECEDNYMKYLQRDRAIFKFKDSLVNRVEKRIKELNISIAAFGTKIIPGMLQ